MRHSWHKDSVSYRCTVCGAQCNLDVFRDAWSMPYVVDPISHDAVWLDWNCDEESARQVQLTKAMRYVNDNSNKPDV